MGGQAGGRGYLIQAIIAVLDALEDPGWTQCVLEPSLGADKIDLLLRSEMGDRVSQIKSSQNAIGAAEIRKWAEELELAHADAIKYELRLIGPVTKGAISVKQVGKVEIPSPQALNIGALLEQCAHRLDHYLIGLGHSPISPASREFISEALATRLGSLAASGEVLSRDDLKELLADWVSQLLPLYSVGRSDISRRWQIAVGVLVLAAIAIAGIAAKPWLEGSTNVTLPKLMQARQPSMFEHWQPYPTDNYNEVEFDSRSLRQFVNDNLYSLKHDEDNPFAFLRMGVDSGFCWSGRVRHFERIGEYCVFTLVDGEAAALCYFRWKPEKLPIPIQENTQLSLTGVLDADGNLSVFEFESPQKMSVSN